MVTVHIVCSIRSFRGVAFREEGNKVDANPCQLTPRPRTDASRMCGR